MTVSIVIPAYNEEQYIASCIESVLRHWPKDTPEVIVVDNGSTDRTAAIARRFPQVTVASEHRKGTGYARQKGLEAATGDIVAFLDADTRIHEEWLVMIEREFANDASLVALSGPYRFYDLPPRRQWLVNIWWKGVVVPAYKFHSFAIIGGNAAVKRSALEAIGGFDTSIAFYGDDTDLARRLARVGTVKFMMDFYAHSSARRLIHQGFVSTAATYAGHFLRQTYRRKNKRLAARPR